MDTIKNRRLKEMTISPLDCPDTYRVIKEHLEIIEPWIFNQIIGWLRLYVIGTSIKAEYYSIKDKDSSKVFELNPRGSESSIDIYENIRSKLKETSSKKPFKGHYIDLEKFCNIGPYVNWRAILNFE